MCEYERYFLDRNCSVKYLIGSTVVLDKRLKIDLNKTFKINNLPGVMNRNINSGFGVLIMKPT